MYKRWSANHISNFVGASNHEIRQCFNSGEQMDKKDDFFEIAPADMNEDQS